MPFNGSGTFIAISNSWSPAVAQTYILSADWNIQLTDLSAALSLCLTRDGQSPPSADLPMNGYKLTGVGAGSALTDLPTIAQIQLTAFTDAGYATGTANALVASLAPGPTAYVDIGTVQVTAIFTNTGAATINFNSLGNVALKDPYGNALTGGEIVDQLTMVLRWDGSGFRIQNPANAATIPPDAEAAAIAIAALGAGIITKDSAGTFFNRALQGTTGEIAIDDPGGAANPPTISLPTGLTFTSKTVTGGTFAGPLQKQMSYVQLNDATGTGSNTVTIDCSLGNAIQITASGTWTLVFSNFPSGSYTEFFIDAINWGAHKPTWPAGLRFDDGKTNFEASLTNSGTDLLLLTCNKAGVFTISPRAYNVST